MRALCVPLLAQPISVLFALKTTAQNPAAEGLASSLSPSISFWFLLRVADLQLQSGLELLPPDKPLSTAVVAAGVVRVCVAG